MIDLPRESVQSYSRPPTLEPLAPRVIIRPRCAAVAGTTRALRVLETLHAPNYYLPPEDVHSTPDPAPGTSLCEAKGVVRHFDVFAGRNHSKACRVEL